MKTLHENIQSDMWYVYKMISDVIDVLEHGKGNLEVAAKARRIKWLIGRVNSTVTHFATAAGGTLEELPADCTLDELRGVSNRVKDAALHHIGSLSDTQILDNPTDSVEGSVYFCLHHAIFYSAVQIGKMHQMLGIKDSEK